MQDKPCKTCRKRKQILPNIQSTKRMNTNQNNPALYKVEDIDWNALESVGISKEQLEASGSMEPLLQGKESEVMPLKLRTSVIDLNMDATLRLVPDKNGRPVLEINGITPENPQTM